MLIESCVYDSKGKFDNNSGAKAQYENDYAPLDWLAIKPLDI